MKSFTSRRFREMYAALPDQVRLQARRAYQLFRRNNIYSARIGLGYRALGQVDGSEIVWFRIGPHGDYDKLV